MATLVTPGIGAGFAPPCPPPPCDPRLSRRVGHVARTLDALAQPPSVAAFYCHVGRVAAAAGLSPVATRWCLCKLREAGWVDFGGGARGTVRFSLRWRPAGGGGDR